MKLMIFGPQVVGDRVAHIYECIFCEGKGWMLLEDEETGDGGEFPCDYCNETGEERDPECECGLCDELRATYAAECVEIVEALAS